MARIIPIPVGPIYTGGPCRGIVHVVEKGDTLYQLGKRYHVSVGQLMFANPFVNVYNLQIGDELCIPISIQPRNQEEMTPREMQREMQQREMMPGEMQREMPREMQEREMMQGEMQREMQRREMQQQEMVSGELQEKEQKPEEMFQEETEKDFTE